MAAEEMNGVEMNGKSVKVRLVKTPGEHTSSLSFKTGTDRSTSKETGSASSVSRLPRTRPRQLGSEQDPEVGFLSGSVRGPCVCRAAIRSFAEQVTPEAGISKWEREW